MFIKIIFILMISAHFGYASTDSNELIKVRQISKLVGTYQSYTNDNVSAIYLTDETFDFYYNTQPYIFAHFKIPINLESTRESFKSLGLEWGYIDTRYQLTDNELIVTKEVVSRVSREIERINVKFDHEHRINIQHSKKIYKRKHYAFGPWLEDKNSYHAVMHGFDRNQDYFKFSDEALPLDFIHDEIMSTAIPLYDLSNLTNMSSQKQQNTNHDLKPEVAEIIEFDKNRRDRAQKIRYFERSAEVIPFNDGNSRQCVRYLL